MPLDGSSAEQTPMAEAFLFLWHGSTSRQKRELLTLLGPSKLAAVVPTLGPDKLNYFQETESIKAKHAAFLQALIQSGAPVSSGDSESSYRSAVVQQSKRVLDIVNQKTQSVFESLGDTVISRIEHAECLLRGLLLDELLRAVATERLKFDTEHLEPAVLVPTNEAQPLISVGVPTEQDFPVDDTASVMSADTPTEIDDPLCVFATKELLISIEQYILTNRAALISGDLELIHALTQLTFKHPGKNKLPAYVAWRCIDQRAETVSWPNLMVEPHPLKAENPCFSTAETYAGDALLLRQATHLVRQQVAHCVLLCIDETLSQSQRDCLVEQLVFYLAEIHRAHNEPGIDERDSPSCYPGTLTRLAQPFRLHPECQAFFEPPNENMMIAGAFFAKVGRLSLEICQSLETIDDRWSYFDALAAYRLSECINVLVDSYTPCASELSLSVYAVHRKRLRLAILDGCESGLVFINKFLCDLKEAGRIKEITDVGRSWLGYLLEHLVNSEEVLAKIFYQISSVFHEEPAIEELVPPPVSPSLLMQYDGAPVKRKHSDDPDAEPPAARPRLSRSPSPTALLDLL